MTNAANAGSWVEEGAPVPLRAMSIAANTLVPKKLAVLTSYTREQSELSNIEALVKVAIGESDGLALDAKMFSADAASAAAPAGLLYGVVPIAAATGGGTTAMVGDISTLIAALGANGAGAHPIIVAAVAQATSLKLLAGPQFDIPILAAASLPCRHRHRCGAEHLHQRLCRHSQIFRRQPALRRARGRYITSAYRRPRRHRLTCEVIFSDRCNRFENDSARCLLQCGQNTLPL